MSVAPIIVKDYTGKKIAKAADSGLAEYARSVRANIYRLWAGYVGIADFIAGMEITVTRGLTRAWYQGAAEVGIREDELEDDEINALQRNILSDISYIPRFGADILEGSKENGGLLRTQQSRGELWINRYNAVRNEARVMAGKNVKLQWVWNPLKEHCLSKGTNVLCKDGWKPIEDIRVGDSVVTLNGLQKVYKTTRNPYYGKLYRVGEVVCTAGHKFLTENGWIKAKNLSNGVETHIAFPNSSNGITARFKILVLRFISPLLRFLPFSKRLKSRMSVPIITVSLDDNVSTLGVDDELGLDKKERFIIDPKSVEMSEQRKLKFGWFIFLNLAIAFEKSFKSLSSFFGILSVIFLDFLNSIRVVHGVIFHHILPRFFVYKSSKSLLIKDKTKFKRTAQNLFMAKPELFTAPFSAFSRVMLPKKAFVFIPHAVMFSRHVFDTIIPSSFTDISAYNTSFIEAAGLLSRVEYVPASDRTESRNTLGRVNLLCKTVAAKFANKLSRWVRTFYATCHNKLPPNSVLCDIISHQNSFMVYNLEVENTHHFIVDGGMVVHNCVDCARLQGRIYRARVWDAYGIMPQSPALACEGWRCGCTLVPTDKKATPGRPPAITGAG